MSTERKTPSLTTFTNLSKVREYFKELRELKEEEQKELGLWKSIILREKFNNEPDIQDYRNHFKDTPCVHCRPTIEYTHTSEKHRLQVEEEERQQRELETQTQETFEEAQQSLNNYQPTQF